MKKLMLRTVVGVVAGGAAMVPAGPAAWAGPAGAQVVARYTFDAGLPGGTAADDSGHGGTLTVRSRYGGAVRSVAGASGRGAGFPAHCSGVCARAILEGP